VEPVRRVFRALSFSRARSVIQKLKYRLINGGSSFASFLKGLEYVAASHRVAHRPRRRRAATDSPEARYQSRNRNVNFAETGQLTKIFDPRRRDGDFFPSFEYEFKDLIKMIPCVYVE